MNRFKKIIDNAFILAWGEHQGGHPFRVFRTGAERMLQGSDLHIRTKKGRSLLQFLSDATNHIAILFGLTLTDVKSLQGQPVIHGSQLGTRSLTPLRIIHPLGGNGFSASSRLKTAVDDKFENCPVVDAPKGAKVPVTPKFVKVSKFHGITDIHAFNGFHSFYSFLRKTFFHTRYVLVTDKDTEKVSMPVYNLSVNKDESYVIPPGIVHNCRCTVVQVRKGKYPESNEQEAMKLGMEATAGKYREMFLFNPGKTMTCFPAYNAYTRKACATCRQRPGNMELASNIPDNELCRACRILQELKHMDAKATRHKAAFLKGTKISHPEFGREVNITGKSIKEWTNQPFEHFYEKNRMLLDIENAFKETSYLGAVPYHKSDDVKWSHIFETEIQGSKAWIIVREYTWGDITLHSISDSLGEYLKEHKPIKKE